MYLYVNYGNHRTGSNPARPALRGPPPRLVIHREPRFRARILARIESGPGLMGRPSTAHEPTA
jgi:hypothetical protein